MKPRFNEKISDRKIIETSKQSSIGKILSGQELQIILYRKSQKRDYMAVCESLVSQKYKAKSILNSGISI
ncbi:hypothetical protein [Nostoc sp.]|uniref:hypothetical protein n=1 Tax=Nostoc sp. TaxID=1180 RepID=UPI002FFD3195